MYHVSAEDGQLRSRIGKVKTILQNEAAECGLAALAMVASAHRQNWTLGELRRRFSISTRGTTLRSLIHMADALGFVTRPIRLEISELPELKLPAILHWGMNHFVVLDRMKNSLILIHDPDRGRRWIGKEEISSNFTGVALELAPCMSMERKSKFPHISLASFAEQAEGLHSATINLLILAIIMQIFSIMSPILNQLIVDEAITKSDFHLVTIFAIGMILLLLISTASQLLQSLIGLYTGTQLAFQMESNLFRRLMRLPISWFEKRHVGDILSRFASLGALQDVMTTTVVSIIVNGIVFSSALVMMMLYSLELTAWQVSGAVIILGIRIVSFPYIRSKTEDGLHLAAKVETNFLETVRSARAFKLFGREQDRISTWQGVKAQVINNQIDVSRFSTFGNTGTGLLTGSLQIISWALGARFVIQGDLTLGMLFAFQAYASQFGGSSAGLVSQAFKLKLVNLHLERVSDIALAEPESGIEMPVDESRSLKGGLCLQGVSFRYGDAEPLALQDVTLEIKPGEFVCFNGPSGGGKTTLLKIMLGLQDPDAGNMLVDSVPLRKFGVRTYRNRVAAVLQDDHLLSGTIADNISFFDVDASNERIKHSAEQAYILTDIEKLPMGFQTLVGDLGSTLSAGQKQRLLLARALYRQPKILFLDEGTANLDPLSERQVMIAIGKLDITRVVIAHREGASLGADRCIRIDGGRIVAV